MSFYCLERSVKGERNKVERSGRMTSREYLRGMMGVENSAVKEVSKGLVVAGIKPAVEEKKARTFVNKVKRNCVITLYKLFKASKQSET